VTSPGVLRDAAPGPVVAVPDGAGIPEPRYPASCRRLGHAGTAVVRVEVGADGRPGRADIVRSAGCAELDRAALDALRRSRFRPARRGGVAVASVLEQRIRFQLR
jgi:protein TonB